MTVVPDIEKYDKICATIPVSEEDIRDVFDEYIEFVASVISVDVYTPAFVERMSAAAFDMASRTPMAEREIAREIFCRKNTERQSGWMPVGARGAFIEILSKIQRIGSCIQIEETVSDAVRDMFNYCIIVMMCVSIENIIGYHDKLSVWMAANDDTALFTKKLRKVLWMNRISTYDSGGALTVDVLQTPVKTIHVTRIDSRRIVISVPADIAGHGGTDDDLAYAARLLVASVLYPRLYR
jgi:hypothetical protein